MDNMAKKVFSVHGHFYQPPREDPLTGEIPHEPGAAPYHDWNERIYHQCYRPNAELGNFGRISFNLGPTLAEWMQNTHPGTLLQIIQQERKNFVKNGVGNGLSQAYNHTILPLASLEDKTTQIHWGIADFEFRFGHKPGGFWLPETAVNLETLTVLAEAGIEFTILAPWQADESDLDVSQSYVVKLPNGKSIAVFFYEQDLSTHISFMPESTTNADQFVTAEVMARFARLPKSGGDAKYLLVASDGELYGHHQPFRDKFLSYLVDGALTANGIISTYPGKWLKDNKPNKEIRILENTSWSCHHGVKRWSGQCGCTPHAEWKAPLRMAFDQIAKAIDEEFLSVVGKHMNDPWQLRHKYIHVLLGQVEFPQLILTLIDHHVEDHDIGRLRLLLEAQFERQRMYTSCGWFFDDFDRIEPRNNVAYAAQAVWLSQRATGRDLSKEASAWLSQVKSWRSGLRADVVFNHHLERAQKSNQ